MINRIKKYYKYKLFYRKKLTDIEHSDIPKTAVPGVVYIFTVTFNNPKLIKIQAELLKKHMKDPHVFIVADNSSNRAKRKEIQAICRETQTGYLSIPDNPEETGSESHACSLNWVFKNYIQNLKPDFFGFIDHDVFCIKPTSLINFLEKQIVFGCFQQRQNYWYLWAGLCFFNFKATAQTQYNFSVLETEGIKLDTGGANWSPLYEGLKKENLMFPKQEYIKIREGDSIQSANMEVIGDWLHSFNGSYWFDMPEKETVLFQFLEHY